MKIEDEYDGKLPLEYLTFLKDNPEGYEKIYSVEVYDEIEELDLFGESSLFEKIEMTGIGSARNFEILQLFIKFQRDLGFADTENPLNESEMKRVEAGIVIGGDYDGYIYLDPSESYSVWIFFPEDGHIEKIAESFSELFIDK